MKILILLLTAACLPIFGQTTPGYPELPQALVQHFSLTPEQSNNIVLLNIDLSDFIDIKFGRWDELDEQVSLELEKTNPDPYLVGQKVVEMVLIDREVEQEVQATVSKVQAVLTVEQKEKLKILENAMRLSGAIQHALNWGLIASPAFQSGPVGLTAQTQEKKTKLSRILNRKSYGRLQ